MRGIAEIPVGGHVAVVGEAAVLLQLPGGVEHVPRREDGVAGGPVVLRAALVVEVRRTRAGLADPVGVGPGGMLNPLWEATLVLVPIARLGVGFAGVL